MLAAITWVFFPFMDCFFVEFNHIMMRLFNRTYCRKEYLSPSWTSILWNFKLGFSSVFCSHSLHEYLTASWKYSLWSPILFLSLNWYSHPVFDLLITLVTGFVSTLLEPFQNCEKLIFLLLSKGVSSKSSSCISVGPTLKERVTVSVHISFVSIVSTCKSFARVNLFNLNLTIYSRKSNYEHTGQLLELRSDFTGLLILFFHGNIFHTMHNNLWPCFHPFVSLKQSEISWKSFWNSCLSQSA